MTKDELKLIIDNLHLSEELKGLIYELIDGSETVTPELLNAVADILDTDAEFLENSADLLEDEADEYEDLQSELEALDAEESRDIVEAVIKNKEETFALVKEKINKINASSAPSALQSSDSAARLEEVTKNLAQASQG